MIYLASPCPYSHSDASAREFRFRVIAAMLLRTRETHARRAKKLRKEVQGLRVQGEDRVPGTGIPT